MSANFKSHVLLRDEKGFLGIPFKRLLLGGISGGMCYTLVRLILPSWALALGIACTLLVIVLTSPRGGIPLWQRLVYRVRGRLLLAAAENPGSAAAQLAGTVDLPLNLVRLDGHALFSSAADEAAVDLREWVTYRGALDAERDDGLVFVDAPLELS